MTRQKTIRERASASRTVTGCRRGGRRGSRRPSPGSRPRRRRGRRRPGARAARYQTPKPERSELVDLTIGSMDADDAEREAGDRERADRPEHDEADVERGPAHVVATFASRRSKLAPSNRRVDSTGGAGTRGLEGRRGRRGIGSLSGSAGGSGAGSGADRCLVGRARRLAAPRHRSRARPGQRPGRRRAARPVGRPRRSRPTGRPRPAPRPGSGPDRPAPPPAPRRPPGSTTCLSRSMAKRMPGQDGRVVEQDDLVEVAPAHRQRPDARERRAQAVGDAVRLDRHDLACARARATPHSNAPARRRRRGPTAGAP